MDPVDRDAAVITIKINGCARCHGEHAEELPFRKLTHPIVAGDETMTHWTSCPTNGEPILLGIAPSSAS